MARIILFVDDEAFILSALRRELRDWALATDTRFLFANSGNEALELLEKGVPSPLLVVSDYRMPGMNGVALITKIKEKWPATATILLSGFSDDEKTQSAMQSNANGFLRKPWNGDELKNAIEEAFKGCSHE